MTFNAFKGLLKFLFYNHLVILVSDFKIKTNIKMTEKQINRLTISVTLYDAIFTVPTLPCDVYFYKENYNIYCIISLT